MRNQKFELKVEMQKINWFSKCLFQPAFLGAISCLCDINTWERKVIIIHPVLAPFNFNVKLLIVISTLLHLFWVICRSTVELEVALGHLAMQLAW
jgi:hypothetical protein